VTAETSTMVDAKPTIFSALAAVMGDVQQVRKGDRNQTQGYSFRGVDATVNAVGPALRKHGVIVVPLVEHVAYNTVEVGQRRTPMRECTVRVRYVFYGPAGDSIECVSAGEAMDSGDKSTPKAMSVAFRVALLQALCIPTDEPEVDASTYERAPARVERARRTSTQDGVPRETGSQQSDAGDTEPIRPQQRTAIQAGFGELGYGGPANRDQRLAVAARLAGLESLGSTNDLTATQARAVLDGLAERRNAQRQENPSG
jgi:hypothetical protein